MPAFTWWIDEPLVIGRSNPSDEDLAQLRGQGFSVGISLLEESKQPPCYDKQSAVAAGWTIDSIPIAENHAPAIDEIHEFMARLIGSPEGAKILVFCQSGKGRTACMGAAYWVTKGLTASAAIARITKACADERWLTPERQRVLDEYDQLQSAADKQ